MYTSHDDQLDQLLRTSISSLDISNEEHHLAISRYKAVGNFLAEYWSDSPHGGEVYPQGSMRLGTVTRNIHRNDEIDIDLVARRDMQKTSITQEHLKDDTGQALNLFVRSAPEGLPSIEEGKRCWTLHYPSFHLDVLPALPDEQDTGTGIVITDTELRDWQFSNPIGYADWFYALMQTEWMEKRAALEKEMQIADVPDWAIKTTLQRTVQALKRHRDIYFADDMDDRPASIIITTLAARAYRGSGSLYDVLTDVTATMPTLVEYRDGIYIVSNPIQLKENFADRWQQHPHRAQKFFKWIEQAHFDLQNLGSERGIDTVLRKLMKAFGTRAANFAELMAGTSLLQARTAGTLTLASNTGTLVANATRIVPEHNFHGSSSPRHA